MSYAPFLWKVSLEVNESLTAVPILAGSTFAVLAAASRLARLSKLPSETS